MITTDYPLPEIETEEDEFSELRDLIMGNAEIEDLREFRKCGVRMGHC